MFYWLIMCDALTQLTLHRARTRELPGHVPFVVNQEYINAVTKEWMGPMEALFRDVYATLVKHVKKLIAQQFVQYPLLQSRITYVLILHL